MRVHRLTTRQSLAAVLGLALAGAVMAAPAPARAADDDVPIDTKILRSILGGLGLKAPGEGDIEYRERAPLVIPPDKDLPPPQRAGAAIANNPAWPKDPDVARAKITAARDKVANSTEQMEREQNPLPPNELAPGAGRSRQARSGRTDSPYSEGYGFGRVLSAKELGYKGGLFSKIFSRKDDEESAKFTGEPARTTLTEPPPGYQVPSPDQPYGLGKDRSPPKADRSYETRGEINR